MLAHQCAGHEEGFILASRLLPGASATVDSTDDEKPCTPHREDHMAKPANGKNGNEPDVTAVAEPLEALIRRRAYELYLERADRPGSALEDWTRAEREACGR